MGPPNAVESIKDGHMAYTVFQPVAVFSREAVIQTDYYIKEGKTKVCKKKQFFNCIPITPDNVANTLRRSFFYNNRNLLEINKCPFLVATFTHRFASN